MSEKLKKHLNKLAEASHFAKILYSQWSFDEEVLTEALQYVSRVFSHSSRHDRSHSIEVLKNIENMLGDKNIERLTATDTWLFLEAAYWHDIGMLVSFAETCDIFGDKQFIAFLDKLSCKPSDDLYSTINAIRNKQHHYFSIDKKLPMKIDELYQIMASFYRTIHAERSASVVTKPDTFDIKSPRTSLIKQRLWYILGRVCATHGHTISDLFSSLEHQENTDGTELCHPRFVAGLLRLGDLLDLDNGRFSDVLARLVAPASFIQKAHEDKHASVDHFLVTPKVIEVTANTKNYTAYEEAAKWMKWLKEELIDLSINWLQIAPEDWDSPLPRLSPPQINMDGDQELLDNGDIPTIKLNIDEAMELFQGAGIYDTKWQAIRELLQNSVDATQIRIWRSHGINVETDEPLKTYHDYIDYAKKYPIEFIIKELAKDDNGLAGETKFRITIKDKGIGISKSDFAQMLQIGNTTSEAKKTLIKAMPAFMRPSGAFGLGLMSAFGLGATEVKFTSMSQLSGEAYEYTIPSPTGSKQICQMKKTDTLQFESYSTRFEMEISVPNVPPTIDSSERVRLVAEALNLSNPLNDYDFAGGDCLQPDIYKILYEAKIFQESSTVPIRITFLDKTYETTTGASVDAIDTLPTKASCFLEYENINISEINFSVKSSYQYIMFKNHFIGKNSQKEALRCYFLAARFDILGESAKDILSINRNQLRNEFRIKFSNDLPKLMITALPKFIDKLPEEQLPFASAFYRLYTGAGDQAHHKLTNRWKDMEVGNLVDATGITMREILDLKKINLTAYGSNHHKQELAVVSDWQEKSEISLSFYYDYPGLYKFLLNELQKPEYKYYFVQEKEEYSADAFIYQVTLQKAFADPVSDEWVKKFLVKTLMDPTFRVGGRVYFPSLKKFDRLSLSPDAPPQYGDFAVPKYNGSRFILPFFFDHQKHKVSTQNLDGLIDFVSANSAARVSKEEIKDSYNNFIEWINDELMKDTPEWQRALIR